MHGSEYKCISRQSNATFLTYVVGDEEKEDELRAWLTSIDRITVIVLLPRSGVN